MTSTSRDDVLGLTWQDDGRIELWGSWPTRHGPHDAFFRGRLTNRRELLTELGLSEVTTDDAVVAHVFDRWSADGLGRLRGVFAAGVVHADRRLAFVVRDQIGSHPLFFARIDSDRSVLFASSARDLLAEPGVSNELNRPALADHLCRRWPDREETFFTAIRRVPPGFRVRASNGVTSTERYWDPAPEDRPVEWIGSASGADVPALFDQLLNQAVDRCQRFGPTGIFLSGGFDSISIAAVAADRARRLGLPVPLALSLEFPHPECNERDTQEAVATSLGLTQHFLGFDDAVGPRALLDTAMKMNGELDAPVLNAWYPAYAALTEVGRREGVTTIMTGNGGDEWLGVSPLLAADLMRRGDLVGLARFMRMWQRSYSPERLPVLKNALWTYGLRPVGSMMLHRTAPVAWRRSRLRRASRRDPDWVAPGADLRGEQQRRLPLDMASVDPPQGFYMQEVRSAIDHTFVSWELEEQFYMGRRAGVCFQHPYWDADLIDMLYRTPPDVLSAGGRSKGLVRGTLARRFPDLGLDRRRKVGAAAFYRSVLATQGPVIAAAARGFPVLTALGIIDPVRAEAGLERAFAERRELYRVWELVNLESWASQFVGLRDDA